MLRSGNRLSPCFRTACLCLLALSGAKLAWSTKAEGPFSVNAALVAHHATITVGASVAVQEVELQLSGTDGLEVQGAETAGNLRVKTLRRPTLAPGEAWKIETDFTPGAGLCYLSAHVSAKGVPPVQRAFAVGELSAAQRAERQRGTTVDPNGVPVKILNPDDAQAQPSPPSAQATPGTVNFPIHAEVHLDETGNGAQIEVTTDAPGSNVSVAAYGLDGLVVEGGRQEGALLVNRQTKNSLAPGELMSVKVRFRPGPGKSALVVEAKGDGIGSSVVTCPVGRETEKQRRSRNQGVTVDPQGVPIRLMGK